jgi:4-oxalomesaconate tautomerase
MEAGGVEEPTVSDAQNCGNLLAGVGPYAVERGLVAAGAERTSVRIRMVNSGGLATAAFPTPGGAVDYSGDTAISGVPGTAAARPPPRVRRSSVVRTARKLFDGTLFPRT